MRIGIYVVQFPTPSETFIVSKVAGLLDAGCDVHVFTSHPSKHWSQFPALRQRRDLHRRIHCGPPTKRSLQMAVVGLTSVLSVALKHPIEFARFVLHNWRTRDTNYLGFWKGVYLRIQFVGHDIDILHVEFDMQGMTVVDLKYYLKCRVLLSSRGTMRRMKVFRRDPALASYLFRHADGYHFISDYLRKQTYDLGLSPSIPTWLIRPAVDLRAFAPKEHRRSGTFRILSIGRLDWEKGYEFAIDAIAILHRRGLQLEYTILGSGPYEEAIAFAIGQYQLFGKRTVRLVGHVSRDMVPRFLADADVVLHAAIDEGFSNAVVEAQAMGVPVVTTNAGGLGENVVNEVSGFVVPCRDPEALADKLLLLARDEQRRRAMGFHARERAKTKFDIETQIAAFLSAYAELSHSPSKKP